MVFIAVDIIYLRNTTERVLIMKSIATTRWGVLRIKINTIKARLQIVTRQLRQARRVVKNCRGIVRRGHHRQTARHRKGILIRQIKTASHRRSNSDLQ